MSNNLLIHSYNNYLEILLLDKFLSLEIISIESNHAGKQNDIKIFDKKDSIEIYWQDKKQAGLKPVDINWLFKIVSIAARETSSIVYRDNITLNHLLKTIEKDGEKFTLTEKEADLLLCLMTEKEPIPKEQILRKAWGYSPTANTKTIETHIYKLRNKIAFLNDFITTEDGYYGFSATPSITKQ